MKKKKESYFPVISRRDIEKARKKNPEKYGDQRFPKKKRSAYEDFDVAAWEAKLENIE